MTNKTPTDESLRNPTDQDLKDFVDMLNQEVDDIVNTDRYDRAKQPIEETDGQST